MFDVVHLEYGQNALSLGVRVVTPQGQLTGHRPRVSLVFTESGAHILSL